MKFDPEIREKIENDPKLQRFMKKRHYKTRSRLLTIARFQYYYEVTKLLPSQAIEEAGDEEDQGIPLRRSRLVQHLEDFDDYLEENYSQNTRQQSMNTIRSFYRRNRITLPEAERLVATKPPVTLTVQDLPGVDDVKKVLTIANVRDTAIILLQLSSGMGRAEIINLTLRDLVDAVNRKNNVELTINELPNIVETRPEWVETAQPLIWFVERVKTRKNYFTFSSTESLEKILDYLDHRPPVTWEEGTKLFRTVTHKGPISPTRLVNIYKYYNNECGFGKAKDGLSYFRSHNIRKLCGNLLKTRIGYRNADMILGHGDRDRTRGDYLKPDIEDLFNLYFENMNQVTITKDVTIKTSDKEEIDKIREEQARKDEKYTEWIEEKDHQIKLQNEQMARMQELINDLQKK
jgi:integrase